LKFRVGELSKFTFVLEFHFKKIRNYEKILDLISKSDLVDFDYSDDANPQFFYKRKEKVYDYRFYISMNTKFFLFENKLIRSPGKIKEKISVNFPENISEFDFDLGEKFSKTNIFREYLEKIEKIKNSPRYVKINNKIIFLHKKLSDLNSQGFFTKSHQTEELIKNFKREFNELNFPDFKKEVPPKYNPPPKKEDLFVKLKIHNKDDFRIWMKKNHPDKNHNRNEEDLKALTKLFCEVTEEGRKKGYLSNGSQF
jgi:hypothetical protein